MRVLLVRARSTLMHNTRLPKSLQKEVGFVPPLGIAYIAAFLREHGVQVGILDADSEELGLQQVRERLCDFDPQLVGVTSMTPTVHDDLAVAQLAKEYGALTVMGGPQISAMPGETLRYHPYVDFGIRGEGEVPMLKLVQALRQDLPLEQVPGLIYRNGDGTLTINPPYIHPDLNTLPVPARDLLPNENYSSIISHGRLTTICAGRGCPFQCGFCFKQPSDQSVRFRAPDMVVDEIEHVVSEYGIKEIDIVTDTFTVNRSFIQEFCEEMIRRNISVSWIAPTRADCVDIELLRLMKRAGCRSLRFGVESGSPKILGLMNKKLEQAKIIRAFQWAKEVGLETFAYFIIGYISEDHETVRETLDFVKVLKPDSLMYNEALPLPATLLWKQSVEAGLVEPDYWERFLQDATTERIPYLWQGTPLWIGRAYREYFLSPPVILKNLLKIRPDTFGNYIKAARGLFCLLTEQKQ